MNDFLENYQSMKGVSKQEIDDFFLKNILMLNLDFMAQSL